MNLNEQDKSNISKEIENLEKLSSAELVAVFTQRSGTYKHISTLIVVYTMLFIALLCVAFTSITAYTLIEIEIFIFIALYFLFDKFDTLILKILPKSYKHEKASQNAHKQFYNLGLNHTKTKQALMFFVSYDEKYVEIITDTVINLKIDDSYWQSIVDEFIKDVKKDELSNGYLKAIKSCKDILVDKFPIQEDDENELSNEVREIR